MAMILLILFSCISGWCLVEFFGKLEDILRENERNRRH